MEEMIARWIRETISEREKAKAIVNLYKMIQMDRLEKALRDMRQRLLNNSTR